jgi:hypothetical protein
MRKAMTVTTNGEESADRVEQVPMHPDDSEALLAWITAKRFHEMVLKETFAEKPVYYRIIG